MQRKASAEFIGTFVLVLGGCGSAVLAAGFAPGGVGLLGVSLAFGLALMVMAFAVGHISGGHFNPAVTVGLIVGRRTAIRDAAPYVAAQLLGAIAGAAVLFVIADGVDAFDASDGFAANGYGSHSPGGYRLVSGLVSEVALTATFLVVILGATSRRAPPGLGPIAIGLALTLIHLVSIPVTNTSVNPARSTGPALFVGESWPLEQLWLFWVAPIAGAIVGALVWRYLLDEPEHTPGAAPAPTAVPPPQD